MKEVIDEAYIEAQKVVSLCMTPHGFFAAYPGYDMVFGRDSMIISIGASLLNNGEDKKIKRTFTDSLSTLANFQSEKGQIPNAIDKFTKRKGHVDFKSIDSTLWFLIGEYTYKKRYKTNSLLKKHKKQIQKALTWLSYQDMGEDDMLEQLPTTDWQDAFPHKYGHTINTQALYHKVLLFSGNKKEANKLKLMTNKNKDDSLWNGKFYIPWRWKNHNKYKEMGSWFDSLGNCLAIIFDLSSASQANKIFSHIRKKRINAPFPMKAIYPPIKRGTKDWQDYFLDSDAGKPYHYLNGGIWTFVGGFYVCALVKQKKLAEANTQLKKLAEANMKKPYFNEWLDGKTGKIGRSASGSNGNQGWNAAMYIAAYESVKKKRCLV